MLRDSRLRIVVLGYIVRGPLGGLAWHHLQYVLGLSQLGHDVYFMEDSDDYPACYDPSAGITGTEPDYGIRFATDAFEGIGLGDRWAYYDGHRSVWLGPCAGSAIDICADADVVINISGVNPIRPWWGSIPVRALIDTDPVFTQVRHLLEQRERDRALHHNVFLTFGENIGKGLCGIPDDGFNWYATRQPIVLDAWPVAALPTPMKFTTVMQWDSYPAREYRGVRYGQKSESFGPYVDMPERAGPIFELALGGATAPRGMLERKHWVLRNPLEVASDPWSYQRYIQESTAEFSVAKHGYVISRSGWFSERSAAYLASGRPVVTQETGFSEWLPSGRGVLSFSTPDEAADSIESINRDPQPHCASARELAYEYFDSRKVLASLIDFVMDGSAAFAAKRNEIT